MKRLVIFDLDGTLLDTIADLAESTNYALAQLGFPGHEVQAYKQFVGNGVYKLFERALPEQFRNQEYILKMKELFFPHYNENGMRLTAPYPGIYNLLTSLAEKGIKIAIASNKYQHAVDVMVNNYFSEFEFTAVYGQREGVNVKPDPTVIFDILSDSGIENKTDVLYVGDSGVDMQTAINAGVQSCGVTWGFRTEEELNRFSPDYIVDNPLQIAEIASSAR